MGRRVFKLEATMRAVALVPCGLSCTRQLPPTLAVRVKNSTSGRDCVVPFKLEFDPDLNLWRGRVNAVLGSPWDVWLHFDEGGWTLRSDPPALCGLDGIVLSGPAGPEPFLWSGIHLSWCGACPHSSPCTVEVTRP